MSIISTLLFIILISSGSVFCASYFNKKYEETLFKTCSAIIIVSFLLGIIGLLRFSTLIICLAGIALIVLGILKAIKDNKVNELLKNIFTPGFVVFIVLTIIMFLGVYNKLFNYCDEFSHWGDSVKMMTILGDFITNPNSHSLFKSYPPAMSLFQYTLEEINIFISGEAFSEWLCYIAYNILCIAFVLPICSKMSYKRLFAPITVVVAIFLIPLSFYDYFYLSTYIDGFLSFLMASGLLCLLFHKENDIWFHISMCMIMFVLTLSKDAGIGFALFLLIGYVIRLLLESKGKIICKGNIISVVAGALSIAIPKVLWSINIAINKANVAFGNKIDLVNLVNVLIGRDDSYRGKVLKNYVTALIVDGYYPGKTGLFVNYICFILITVFTAYFIIKLLTNKQMSDDTKGKSTFISLVCSIILYTISLCVVYMYSFSEGEALYLASFERYIHIVFLGAWLFIILALIVYVDNLDKWRSCILGFIICFLFYNSDLEAALTFVTNVYAKSSIQFRSEYNDVVEKTLQFVDGNDKVWFIEQGETSEKSLQYQFLIRPNYISGENSIGSPVYEDDTITEYMTADDWKNELLKGDFDYVLLYKINDDFIEEFGTVFEKPQDIVERNIYKVNKNTGLLSLCE